MPLIQVTLTAGRTDEQKRVLMAALTQAAHTSIGAPIASIRVWINEVAPTEFMAAGETMAERQAASPAEGAAPATPRAAAPDVGVAPVIPGVTAPAVGA